MGTAAINQKKEDLSVDTVHTDFGLTKHRPANSLHSRNEPKLEFLTQDFEVMLRSVPYP